MTQSGTAKGPRRAADKPRMEQAVDEFARKLTGPDGSANAAILANVRVGLSRNAML